MPEGHVLRFTGVTKRFGTVDAVNGFSARVEPGVVTGFLGPNGAGKTTTLRILLGLIGATTGSATIAGRPYAQLSDPLQTVGAVLEASSFHPGRSAANHLKVYAQAAGLPLTRVDESLGMVGLADVGGRKVGGFSLGMRQRLGLAYALLGDPGVLVLDEPANGLDPEGIKWLRGLLRELARQGRTVLVSSHLLTEVAQTVDALLIIAGGRLVFQGGLDELTDPSEYATVVDSPERAALSAALGDAGIAFEVLRSGFTVRGTDPVTVGRIAAATGVPLSGLQRRGPALEEVFLDLVNGVRVHPSGSDAPAVEPSAAAVIAHAEPEVEAEPEPETEAETEAEAEPEALPEAAASVVAELDAESSGIPGGAAATSAAAGFAVASTGVIDIIPRHSEEPVGGDGPPTDADVDVEAIGQIDDELQDALDAPEAEPEPDRPWERRERTAADEEADRFFAAFSRDPDAGEDAPGDDGADEGAEGGEPR